MPRLGILITKTVDELVELYELACTDLANSHEELAVAMSDLHLHYLEIFGSSQGKSVSEKNRECDYQTRHEYAEIVKMRGRINKLHANATMIANLIGWRSTITPLPLPDQLRSFPPNHDVERIGNGR